MLNQELPKDVSSEAIKEQTENFEQKDISAEKPKEDAQSILLALDEKIIKKEEAIESTQNEINNVRGELGLAPSNEIPPSIKKDQDSLNDLKQEKENVINKTGVIDKNEEKPEEIKIFEKNFKNTIESISSNAKVMLDALYERQQQGLTPIQSNDHFQAMVSSLRNFRNFESKINLNSVSEVIADVRSLSGLFNDFSLQRVASPKESRENLEKLSFGAKHFSGAVQESYRKLPVEMQNKEMETLSKELRIAMQNLSENSQRLWMLAAKMRENLH